MASANVKQPKSNLNKGLYCIIWRWHFYAGLLCIPLIITLAISGGIYLFKPQIDSWIDAPYQNLAVTAKRSTANQQINAALMALPGSRFSSYQLPEHAQQAVVVHLLYHGRRMLVYVNPYNLQVLKKIDYEDQFIRMVRTFHGELLAGDVGSVIVELAACWAIVLILTGLYLWWPRSSRTLAGVVYPRLRQGRRVFWRDLHAVIAIWISSMVLFLLITGLPWTLVWGSAFKELRQWNVPIVKQDWTLSRAEENTNTVKMSVARPNLSETLLARSMVLNVAPPALLSVSRKDSNIWKLKSRHQNRPLRIEAWLNGETGEIIRKESFNERPVIDRVIGIGVAAHEGQLFGWFNQLLGVITALGLVLMSISGFVLWQRRKPVGSLGAPPLLPNVRVGKIVVMITLLLAAVLPLLAISILVILLVEWFVLKRIEPSRKWLGLQTS